MLFPLNLVYINLESCRKCVNYPLYMYVKKEKTKTIQTLLTSNRKNRRNRGNLYVHLYDCSLSWIGQVTSIEIVDVKLVLCSLLVKWWGHASVFFISKMITLTLYLLISIVGGPYQYSTSVRAMVLNVTFNSIAVISWRSFLLVGETGVPGKNNRPLINLIT
jgi:hypothetical protein